MNSLALAAPIQTTLIDHPWQVVLDGMVIAHCKKRGQADGTAAQYPGSTVRYVG